MKLKIVVIAVILIFIDTIKAQEMNDDKLPYYEIPDYPSVYNACTVAARMVDGLGFRYYWATEGLRNIDLEYKPSEEARTSRQTLEHLHGLVLVILNSTLKQPHIGKDVSALSYAQLRKETLENLKQAADILRTSENLSEFKIIFQRGENTSEFPFWNQINGPIADALWHCGQVVSLRRSSGNPFNSKASVFSGKVRQ
jgi:hypothetical protein